MITNLFKLAKMCRTADAFSDLTRGGFLSKQIDQKGLYSKLNTSNDPKFKDKITIFVADLINQITIKYVGKANSDLIKWFLDNFIKQRKHLQDIILCDSITYQDVESHVKKQTINNLQNFISDNGSCIHVLQCLKQFKKINSNLPKQQQIKIKQIDFFALVQFVQSKKNNLNEIMLSGQPKTLDKVNVPGVTSYKVYKCYPPQDKSKWRQCPQYIELHEKFASEAKWCVIQGSIPYGSYLNSKWNFYVLVTTNSNKPVMLFNFSNDSNGQIKDVHDLSFSSYNEQLFRIIDWFAETYDYNPTNASDYAVYLKIKKIYLGQKENDLQLVFQSNNYSCYRKKEGYKSFYYLYNKNEQCKFFGSESTAQETGSLIRIGSKDKISQQVVDIFIKCKCDGILSGLISKKILQKQNGNAYILVMKYLLSTNKQSFIRTYLQSDVIDDIMPFSVALSKLSDDTVFVKQLLLQGNVDPKNYKDCFQYIFKNPSKGIQQICDLLETNNFKSMTYQYLESNFKKQKMQQELDVFGDLNSDYYCMCVDNTTKNMISCWNQKDFKLFKKQFLIQQTNYFIREKIWFPLLFLQSFDQIKNCEQLVQKIDSLVNNNQASGQIVESICFNAQLDKQVAQKLLDFNVQNKNVEFIQFFVVNYDGSYGTYQLDFSDLYNYVNNSNDEDLIFNYLDNQSILYNDDQSYQTARELVNKLAQLNINRLYSLNWNDYQVAEAVANAYINNQSYSQALEAMESVDTDQIQYIVSSYLYSAKQDNNAQAIVDCISKFEDLIENSEEIEIQEYIDFVSKSQTQIVDLMDSIKNKTLKNRIVYIIIQKGSKKATQSLVKSYYQLDDSQQQAVIECLINNDYLDLIQQININDISSYYIDDIVNRFSMNGRYEYILQLVKNDETQYQYIADEIYDNKNQVDLFLLGTKVQLDKERLSDSLQDIFVSYIVSEIRQEHLFANMNKKLIQYMQYNKIGTNTLFYVVENVFNKQIKVNQVDFEKFILWGINVKILQADQNLFNLLIANKKLTLLLMIPKYKDKKDRVLQQLANSEDSTKLDYEQLELIDIIDVMPDEKLVQFLQIKYIDPNALRHLIKSRIQVVLSLIIDKHKKFCSGRKDLVEVMKKCVDEKIDKNKCKQFCKTFGQLLGTDLFVAMENAFGTKYEGDERFYVDRFKDYINEGDVKLSKKLFDLANKLIYKN